MKRLFHIEIIAVVISLLFAIAISLYHISYTGYLGLNKSAWGSLWAISENGLSLTLCFLLVIYSSGVIKLLFQWLFIPYFVLKLVYHFSCYSKIYIFSTDLWENIWSFVLVFMIITGLFFCLYLIKKKDVA